YADGRGGFGDQIWYAAGAFGAERLIASDLNGDGLPDLATGTTALQVLPGASGGFGPPQTVDLGPDAASYSALAVGDLDDDGRPDIVSAEHAGSGVRVHYNRTPLISISAPAISVGSGAFKVPYTVTGFLSTIRSITIEMKRPDPEARFWSGTTFAP